MFLSALQLCNLKYFHKMLFVIETIPQMLFCFANRSHWVTINSLKLLSTMFSLTLFVYSYREDKNENKSNAIC